MPSEVFLDGEAVTLDLPVTDNKEVTEITATSDVEDLILEVVDGKLTITPQPGWRDEAVVRLTAFDKCDNAASTTIDVFGDGDDPASADCDITISWTPSNPDVQAVSVAGAFNEWDTEADPLEQKKDGTWHTSLTLQPGAYPYKIVEIDPGLFDDGEAWACDPAADYIQCDAGYKAAGDYSWDHVCAPGVGSCNSLLIVEPCEAPSLELVELDIDRDAGTVSFVVETSGEITKPTATLDGDAIDVYSKGTFSGTVNLDAGRHTLRFSAKDAEEVYVPVWMDDFAWEDGVLYFAFIDRLKNGDSSNDSPEGATGADYEGGDVRGLIDMLPYLDDLGVTVLWLSNLQGNASDAWAGDCDATYAGYHAYWPDDAFGVDEHLGSDADVVELVDEAHARGMRVIMDWVANHVHETHPYYVDHPEWFNDYAFCKDSEQGQLNFDRIPETCWFAPYLPDIDYGNPEPLVQMVDDAMWWAKTYELDGFRVDAVKHMPHAVAWNLQSAVRDELEHTAAGGDEDFWTVGETFDGYAAINAYVGPNQLDGQFDFPIYFTMRPALAGDDATLPDLMNTQKQSDVEYGPDAIMSTFLGNHDVLRFTTDAAEFDGGACEGDGVTLRVAQPTSNDWAYDRMKIGWTFLFTHRQVPLIYYGDELGIPGYGDPDNRQPLWWHADLNGVQSVDDMVAAANQGQGADMVQHIKKLADARAAHPALRYGSWTEWWNEDEVFGYARSNGNDHALIVLNKSGFDRTLDNAVGFAGLPQGTYDEVLTGGSVSTSGDFISVFVPANDSRVFVLR